MIAKFEVSRWRVLSIVLALALVFNVGVTTVSAAKIVAVKEIAVKASVTKVSVGKTLKLNATVSPANATNKKVTWSSSEKRVATVDANGTVKGVSNGTVQITATSTVGLKKASVKITVYTPVTSVKFAYGALTLSPKDVQLISAALVPASANNKQVTWSSSNPAIVKIEATKTSLQAKLTAVAYGSAVISVKTADGGKLAKLTVTVNDDKKAISPVLNAFLGLARVQDISGMAASLRGATESLYYVKESYSMFPQVFVDRLKKNNADTTFQIKSMTITQNTAKIVVAAIYLDDTEYLGAIYSNAILYAVSQADALVDQLTDEEYDQMASEFFKEGLAKGIQLNSGENATQLMGEESVFSVELTKVNGIWKISNFGEEITNFMTSGLTGLLSEEP